jgi:drug/metabolite transporter (DMT)-like permease
MNQYIASTAVILSEVLKFILSAMACYVIDAKCNFTTFCDLIYNMVMEEGADSLKLCVPALLYTIQNNLQYIIEEAPLFLVLYQAKIVTTAVFYSTLLSRRLSTKEWACIVALALGVSMVESSQVEIVPNHASNITGVAAVVFACLSSGVAGVSFEKILKSSRSSIWMINMQMSLLSAFFCTVTIHYILSWIFHRASSPGISSSFLVIRRSISLCLCTCCCSLHPSPQSVALTQDSVEIVHHGVFTGYNPLVLLSIVLQAITGLVRRERAGKCTIGFVCFYWKCG